MFASVSSVKRGQHARGSFVSPMSSPSYARLCLIAERHAHPNKVRQQLDVQGTVFLTATSLQRSNSGDALDPGKLRSSKD